MGVPPSQVRPRWCTTLLPVGRAPKDRKGDFARGQPGAGMPRAGDEAPQRDGGCALRGPGYPGPASRVDGWAPVTNRLGTPQFGGQWEGGYGWARRGGRGWVRGKGPDPGERLSWQWIASNRGRDLGSISLWTSPGNGSCNRRFAGGGSREIHTLSATRGGTDGAAADALRDRPAAVAEGRYEPATIGGGALRLGARRWRRSNRPLRTRQHLTRAGRHRGERHAEGDNLTREHVDDLVRTAVDKLARVLARTSCDLASPPDGRSKTWSRG